MSQSDLTGLTRIERLQKGIEAVGQTPNGCDAVSMRGKSPMISMVNGKRTNLSRKGKPSACPASDRPGEPSKFFKICQGQVLTTLEKASIAETAIAFRLALRRFRIFQCLSDGDTIDLVVAHPELKGLIRLQVKWGRWYTKKPTVHFVITNTRQSGKHKRFKINDYDVLVGYDLFADKAYVYGIEEVVAANGEVAVNRSAEEHWDQLTRAAIRASLS